MFSLQLHTEIHVLTTDSTIMTLIVLELTKINNDKIVFLYTMLSTNLCNKNNMLSSNFRINQLLHRIQNKINR